MPFGQLPRFVRNSGPILPTSFPGLLTWMNVDSLQLSGSFVLTANDVSGAGNPFNNGTTPPDILAGAYANGTKPTIRFQNGSHLYRSTSGTFLNFTAGVTVFYTMRSYNGATQAVLNAKKFSVSNPLTFGLSSNNITYQTGAGSRSIPASVVDGDIHMVAVTHATNGVVSFYLDGVFIGSPTNLTYGACQVNEFGDQAATGTNPLYIGEIFAYNAVRSAAEIASLYGYANARWGGA